MTGQRTRWSRRRHGIVLTILGLGTLAPLARPVWGDTPRAVLDREYQIKAAFVYNFIKFVAGGRLGPADGKITTPVDPNEVLRVGIVGEAPSKEGLAKLQGRIAQDKRIEVRYFRSCGDRDDAGQPVPQPHPQMDQMRRCHVLFFCPSERPFLTRILPPLQSDGILLIGDTSGFLEAGGIINLVIEDKKVRFEINLAAAKRANLQVRSSLLRLAIRTIEHDSLEKPKDEGR